MLVLSRRENDRIVFPTLGITVEVKKLTRSRASIGVFAPQGIRVIRHELLADEEQKLSTDGLAAAIRQEIASHIESEIDAATDKLKAAREALLGGNTDDVIAALGQALVELEVLREAAARNKSARNKAFDMEHSEDCSVASGVAEPAALYTNSATEPSRPVLRTVQPDCEHSRLENELAEKEFEIDRSGDAMFVFYQSSRPEKLDAVLLLTSEPNDDSESTIRLIKHCSPHRMITGFACGCL